MLGNFRIRVRDGTEQAINPIQIIRYWNFSHSNPQDDLMLIKLAKPARLNNKVQPLPLATSNVRPGTVCLLAGLDWSQNNNGECTPPQQIRVISHPRRGAPCPHSWEERRGEGAETTSGLAKRPTQKPKAPPFPGCWHNTTSLRLQVLEPPGHLTAQRPYHSRKRHESHWRGCAQAWHMAHFACRRHLGEPESGHLLLLQDWTQSRKETLFPKET